MSCPNVNTLEILRPVGRLEQWSTGRHGEGCLYNVGVSCSYSAANSRSLTPLIFSALAAVIQQHPILAAIPNDQDSEFPQFVRLPTIDLRDIVEHISRTIQYNDKGRDEELDHLLEDRLNVPFNTGHKLLPFWRVLVLYPQQSRPEFVMTFIYHHGIADGMSGAIFHESFLAALNENHPILESPMIDSPRTSLLPNFEMVHDLDENLSPRPDLDNSMVWSGELMQSPVVGRFRSSVFERSTTDRLVKLCKDNRTTITATIQVILAVSLFRLLPSSFFRLRSITPVDVRYLLRSPIDRSSMGVFVDFVRDSYNREDLRSFSWSEARGARETILAYVEEASRYLNSAYLKHIQGINRAMLDCLGQKRDYGFEVSNLGFVGAGMRNSGSDKNWNWNSGRMIFSRSASALSPALGCGVVTGADGCLVLGYNWQVGVVDNELVAKLIRNVEDQILKLTS